MKRFAIKSTAIAAVAFVIVACSGGGGTTFSCASANGSSLSCYEYKNVSGSQLNTLNSSCGGTKGTGCPTENLVGCCTASQMANGLTIETCYYAPITAASAQKGCMLTGTWSTTP